MNANELADKLNNSNTNGNLCDEAATMLRQQQAEIETYKLELYDEVMLRREQQAEIETLKSHPVKELTDAEIWSISAKHGNLSWHEHTLNFARAVLKKAQEK